jgi:hypothetical protein
MTSAVLSTHPGVDACPNQRVATEGGMEIARPVRIGLVVGHPEVRGRPSAKG